MKSTQLEWVPKEVLIPVGQDGTREFGKCADNWSDSEVCLLRSRLPQKFHAVPTDWLRRAWINLRKAKTPGFKTKGHGPSKMAAPPKWYADYLESDWWGQRKAMFLAFWDYSCCICNSGTRLDVHHRTYERLGRESDNDCVVLCRECHKRHHRAMNDGIENAGNDSTPLFAQG